MQYVKIIFRDKRITPINLSLTKWQSILNDTKTLVAYLQDGEKDWSGRTLNKAEVVFAEPDEDYTKKMAERLVVLYRNKETNNVVRCLDGELPDDISLYEAV